MARVPNSLGDFSRPRAASSRDGHSSSIRASRSVLARKARLKDALLRRYKVVEPFDVESSVLTFILTTKDLSDCQQWPDRWLLYGRYCSAAEIEGSHIRHHHMVSMHGIQDVRSFPTVKSDLLGEGCLFQP